MARVKIEEIIEYLDSDMKSALEDAVKRTLPGAEVNRVQLFRAFVRAVGRKCSTWERVPDHYVKVD
jgi:hypothetical protein